MAFFVISVRRCVRLAPGILFDEFLAGRLHIGEHTCTYASEDGNAERRSLLGFDGLDFATVHIGEHLAPDAALATAATGHHFVDVDLHFAQDIEAVE